MLTQLLALLVTQSDVWVVSVASPAEHVAYYGVATRIAQLVSLPHLVLGGVLPPMIAEHLASGRRHELERMLRPVVLLAAVPSMGLALLLGVLGTQILSVGFGPAYATAAVPLTILAVGNVVNVLCGPCSQVLLLSHNQLTLNLITAASAILCIGGGVSGVLPSVWPGRSRRGFRRGIVPARHRRHCRRGEADGGQELCRVGRVAKAMTLAGDAHSSKRQLKRKRCRCLFSSA